MRSWLPLPRLTLQLPSFARLCLVSWRFSIHLTRFGRPAVAPYWSASLSASDSTVSVSTGSPGICRDGSRVNERSERRSWTQHPTAMRAAQGGSTTHNRLEVDLDGREGERVGVGLAGEERDHAGDLLEREQAANCTGGDTDGQCGPLKVYRTRALAAAQPAMPSSVEGKRTDWPRVPSGGLAAR